MHIWTLKKTTIANDIFILVSICPRKTCSLKSKLFEDINKSQLHDYTITKKKKNKMFVGDGGEYPRFAIRQIKLSYVFFLFFFLFVYNWLHAIARNVTHINLHLDALEFRFCFYVFKCLVFNLSFPCFLSHVLMLFTYLLYLWMKRVPFTRKEWCYTMSTVLIQFAFTITHLSFMSTYTRWL